MFRFQSRSCELSLQTQETLLCVRVLPTACEALKDPVPLAGKLTGTLFSFLELAERASSSAVQPTDSKTNDRLTISKKVICN